MWRFSSDGLATMWTIIFLGSDLMVMDQLLELFLGETQLVTGLDQVPHVGSIDQAILDGFGDLKGQRLAPDS